MSIIPEATNEEAIRRHMIDGLLLPNDVTDERVIEAIELVNRQSFVSAERKGVAYIDKSIKVADGRYMMDPCLLRNY
jgi:protein-L-isoaspartate(D-aspartate) O-methyltransferase